jgi:hypothetical protein
MSHCSGARAAMAAYGPTLRGKFVTNAGRARSVRHGDSHGRSGHRLGVSVIAACRRTPAAADANSAAVSRSSATGSGSTGPGDDRARQGGNCRWRRRDRTGRSPIPGGRERVRRASVRVGAPSALVHSARTVIRSDSVRIHAARIRIRLDCALIQAARDRPYNENWRGAERQLGTMRSDAEAVSTCRDHRSEPPPPHVGARSDQWRSDLVTFALDSPPSYSRFAALLGTTAHAQMNEKSCEGCNIDTFHCCAEAVAVGPRGHALAPQWLCTIIRYRRIRRSE